MITFSAVNISQPSIRITREKTAVKLLVIPLDHESNNFFFNQVVNLCKELLRDEIDCNTLDTFKYHLDKHSASSPWLSLCYQITSSLPGDGPIHL